MINVIERASIPVTDTCNKTFEIFIGLMNATVEKFMFLTVKNSTKITATIITSSTRKRGRFSCLVILLNGFLDLI
jgi:hypothetical protein